MDISDRTSSLGELFLWVMLVAILGVAVAIPVILDVINTADVSGTTALVLGLLPLFVALILIVAMSQRMMARIER